MKTKIRKSRPGGTILLPGTLVSIVSFRQVGHGVGQTVDPHFDPHEKVQIRNKKHPKSDDFRCFLELLGGFEPPTSSLPIPYTSVLLFISYCKLSYVIRCIRCSSKCFLISLLFPFVISWVLLCTSLRCRCVFWCVFPDGVPENLGCTAAAFLIGVGVHPQRDGGVAVAQGLTHRGHIRPGGDGY